jgi:hypothetical protein|tara:strand:- start:564 stop:815 length:252 start_codon:yes stop_codon:yes gene_type:complete
MKSNKEQEREELQRLVDEYLEDGNEIEQVPTGLSGGRAAFHGYKTANGKAQLYCLSEKKAGFETQRITLSTKGKMSNIQSKVS